MYHKSLFLKSIRNFCLMAASQDKRALLIVDVQNDFLEGGSLEVKDGNQVIPLINKIRKEKNFDLIALSSDWHPQIHCSFQSNNPGSKLFQPFIVEKTQNLQVMWPDHCVQGTFGAEFHKDLIVQENDTIIRKGTNEYIESYSAFGTYPEDTGLNKILEKNDINTVYVVGLAYDYCVGHTALDALKNGYKTYVITDLTRSVAAETEIEMVKKLKDANCNFITLNEFDS